MSADERSARRLQQFLDAGLEVFAERGWAASTVSDVCRAAGLSPRYFYELFGSREDLFRAVTARIAERVHTTVRVALDGSTGNPEERARAVLGALADWFTADPRTVRVALMESLATEEFRQQRRELLEAFNALAARLMRSLWPSGAGGSDVELSAAVLTGGLVELLIAHASRPVPPELGPLLDHLTALYTAAARL
nr:TetR/AcrR family transcriptional regulator [Blastococcus saxobsidens]